MLSHHSEKLSQNTTGFDLSHVHSSWRPILTKALATIEPSYLQQLHQSTQWLPGPHHIFNAFSLPLSDVNYVLFGESPYPREQSANGYAFWDAAVASVWSDTGLSKPVNRATSLRNIVKMLLIAEGRLTQQDTTQMAISAINKHDLIQTNDALFKNLLQHGFLLLNATPVLQVGQVRKDAKCWKPFIKHVLAALLEARPQLTLILLGNIANEIDPLITQPHVRKLYAEHPYNLSFVTNPTVIDFFRPFHLLLNADGQKTPI